MKSKFLILVAVNLVIILGLVFHEKFLNGLDRFIMPNSAELCKVVPAGLGIKYFISAFFGFLLII